MFGFIHLVEKFQNLLKFSSLQHVVLLFLNLSVTYLKLANNFFWNLFYLPTPLACAQTLQCGAAEERKGHPVKDNLLLITLQDVLSSPLQHHTVTSVQRLSPPGLVVPRRPLGQP